MRNKKYVSILFFLFTILIGGLIFLKFNKPKIKEVGIFNVYLPFIQTDGFPALGVQVDGEIPTNTIQYVISNRIYQSPLRWEEVEEKRGVYLFPSWMDKNISSFGNNPLIIGTRTTPIWARLWLDKQGSPPKDENFTDYGLFLQEIIQKYRPWGIEIYNEPDVQNTLPNDLQYWFGAWVDGNDYYGAGVRYANLTCVAYPLAKSIDPNVKILAGALIGADTSLQFIQGMIDSQICADYITFHGYVYNEEEFDRIFLFSEKLSSLMQIPQIVTETSALSEVSRLEHDILKAKYINYIREKQRYSNIFAIEIYSWCNSWLNCGILSNCIQDLAYDAWSSDHVP